MNFLAALLYLAVGDEIIAFNLLIKVMFDINWREVYLDQLVKLVSLTKKFKSWLLREQKILAVHLDYCGVILEAQLSSPFMGIFANLIDLEQSLRVLDRFLYFGEAGIVEIVKQAFLSQKLKILSKKEPFDL